MLREADVRKSQRGILLQREVTPSGPIPKSRVGQNGPLGAPIHIEVSLC